MLRWHRPPADPGRNRASGPREAWRRTLAFSPETWHTLASAGADHQVRSWQVANGQLLLTLAGPRHYLSRIWRFRRTAARSPRLYGKIYRWLQASPNDTEPPPPTDCVRLSATVITVEIAHFRCRAVRFKLPSRISNPVVFRRFLSDAQSVKTFVLPKVGNIEAFKTYNAPLDAASFVVADLNRNGAVDMAFANRSQVTEHQLEIAIMSSLSSQLFSTSENQQLQRLEWRFNARHPLHVTAKFTGPRCF